MSTVHEEIKERTKDTLSSTVPLHLFDEEFDEVTDTEVERAIQVYKQKLDMKKRVELAGEMYVTAHIIRNIMVERGVMITHSKRWPAPHPEERVPNKASSETQDVLLDIIEKARESKPTGYGELIERYIGLTDSLLTDLTYDTHGDPITGEDVRVVCEYHDQRFEITLETDDYVDMDGLTNLLNRVVDETTDVDRRFGWTDIDISTTVGVFFYKPMWNSEIEAYYQASINSALK